MKNNILLIAYHEVARDPRVYRQIKWLHDKFNIFTVCKIPDLSLDVNYIIYPSESYFKSKLRLILLKLRLFDKYLWNKPNLELVEKLKNHNYDIIIAHHINLLPIAFRISSKAKIILDAHEFYTEVYNDSFLWRFLMKDYYIWLSDNFIPKCDLVIAVNESMRKMYESKYKIKTQYITNAADYEDLSPRDVSPSKIKIIHHGLASSSRKLELMIEVMKYVDSRFSLTFSILEINRLSSIYVNKLKKLAQNNPNIEFIKPVPGNEVISLGNKYDIGLFFMPPSNINEEYSLANKFFQYVQSRLMLAVSPLPEMKRLVEEYNIGIVSKDYSPISMANALNSLTHEQVLYFKAQSNKHALDLSAQQNEIKFNKIISEFNLK